MKRILLIAGLLLACLSVLPSSHAAQIACGAGLGSCANSLVQSTVLFNSQTTGAATTAVTVTIAAAPAQRAHLYSVEARCNTAAATSNITVTDGGTTIFSSAAALTTTNSNYVKTWDTPLSSATNSALVVTWAACSAGTGTLIVQADRY